MNMLGLSTCFGMWLVGHPYILHRSYSDNVIHLWRDFLGILTTDIRTPWPARAGGFVDESFLLLNCQSDRIRPNIYPLIHLHCIFFTRYFPFVSLGFWGNKTHIMLLLLIQKSCTAGWRISSIPDRCGWGAMAPLPLPLPRAVSERIPTLMACPSK